MSVQAVTNRKKFRQSTMNITKLPIVIAGIIASPGQSTSRRRKTSHILTVGC